MNLKAIPQPKGVYIVVKKLPNTEEDGMTSSGIYAPENKAMACLFERAEVVAVGTGHPDHQVECRVGDKVLVNKTKLSHTDRTFKVDFEDYFLLSDYSDVYAWISRVDGGYYIPTGDDNETVS